MTQIFLCTNAPHPRLSYVCDWLLGEQLGLEWAYLPLEAIQEVNGPVLWYAGVPPPPDFKGWTLFWSGQLTSLTPGGPAPATRTEGARWYLFPSNDHPGQFDWIASIFWLLSRLEEYGDAWAPDEFGRFNFTQSLLFREGVLQVPVVDYWVRDFERQLTKHFGIIFPERTARWEPTFDCDLTWAFKHKSFIKQVGGWAKDLVKGNLEAVLLRPQVWMGRQNDPFETYEVIGQLGSAGWKVKVFFPVGDASKYDVQADYQLPEYQLIIQTMKQSNCTIGIHPSFPSMERETLLPMELQRLENILGESVVHSRQHYLRFRLPATYRALAGMGIEEEYSMGYAENTGFRAGTSHPFYWYDLENETVSRMRIHPFCLMDVALRHYRGFNTPAEAIHHALKLLNEVQTTGGIFGTCWHNNSLANKMEWKGWTKVWEAITEKASTLKP